MAQVRGHRLAQSQQADGEAVHLMLDFINLDVGGDDLAGQIAVAPDQSLHGSLQLRLGQTAHAGDQVGQMRQLLVIGSHGVLVLHPKGSGSQLSRNGR